MSLIENTLGKQNSSCSSVDSTAEKITKVCACCFILLGSFFGNIFIIIIVYKHRESRKTINYFIVNMAVSDLVFPLILIPVRITVLLTDSWHWRVGGIFGTIFCKLHFFLFPLSLHVAAQSLVWMSIDRFVAVVFPMKLGLISTKIRTAAIVSTWIFAGLFNFHRPIIRGLVVHGNNRYCSAVNKELIFPNQKAISVYFWLKIVFFQIAAIFLMTVLYTAITVALKKQNKAFADAASNVHRHSFEKRRRAIKMSVVIVVMVYVCVIPQTLRYLAPYINWTPSCAFQRSFTPLARFLFYSSFYCQSSDMPVICWKLSSWIEKHFMSLCENAEQYDEKTGESNSKEDKHLQWWKLSGNF